MKIDGEHFLCVIDDIISKQECKNLLDRANIKGWHVPKTGGNYMRSIIIDEVLSIDLFSRIKPHLPETYNGYTLEYLNSHFRFSKYDKNGKFPIHVDGKNYDEKKNKEGYNYESLMTLNIFLNDDFEGGQTDFFFKDFKLRYSVEPKAGRGALFYHKQLHRGNKVLQPYKYLIRTDVMGIQI